jgi:hypothetical protein
MNFNDFDNIKVRPTDLFPENRTVIDDKDAQVERIELPKRKRKQLTIDESAIQHIAQPEFYIVNKLKLKNGIVNVCEATLHRIDFDKDGKYMGAETKPLENHFGEVELNFFWCPNYTKYIDSIRNKKSKNTESFYTNQPTHINAATSSKWYYSLFNALLNKFPDEIYVVCVSYGCYAFDKNKVYQGLYTFVDTGFGYLNCQIPVYELQQEYADEKDRLWLKERKNRLDQAQAAYDAPRLRLEAAKAAYEASEKEMKEKNKKYNKTWGYLK